MGTENLFSLSSFVSPPIVLIIYKCSESSELIKAVGLISEPSVMESNPDPEDDVTASGNP